MVELNTGYPDYGISRFVAFIDILGFSGFLGRLENEPGLIDAVRSALDALAEASTGPGQEAPDNLVQATVFSDNIVISAQDQPFALAGMLLGCSWLCLRLLELGFFTRGGIVYGKLAHDSRLVFGSGLVEAAELEANVAIYPRVVFSTQMIEKVRELREQEPWFQNMMRRDFDGLHHLHYLQAYDFGENFLWSVLPRGTTASMAQPFRLLRDLIAARVGEPPTSLRVRSKVLWMARYLNESASAIGVDPISDAI